MEISISSVNTDINKSEVSKGSFIQRKHKYVLPIIFQSSTASSLEKIYSCDEYNHHYDYNGMSQRRENLVHFSNQPNINQFTLSLPKSNVKMIKNATCKVGMNNYQMTLSLSPPMYEKPNKRIKSRENIHQNSNIYHFSTKARVPFSKDEDEKIKNLVDKYGTRKWQLIASFIDGRTPKQCRDRYSNYLVPGYFKGEWSNDEDELLTKLFNQMGPKWSIMQKSFPGRSSNSIKNRWKFFLCRQTKSESDDIDNEPKLEEKTVKNDFYHPYGEGIKMAEMFSIKNLINS